MSYGTICYNGFIYRMENNVGIDAVKALVGDALCTSSHFIRGEYENLRYRIENKKLILNSAILYINGYDLNKVLENGSLKPEYEKTTGVFLKDGSVQISELYKLTFSNINLDISFSGELCAKQLFVDEQYEENGRENSEPSYFLFKNGILNVEKSHITSITKTKIEEYAWRDELNGKIQKNTDKSRRIYYLSPTGSIAQNDFLISAVINYLSCGFLKNELIDKLLSYKTIILRVDFMEEVDPLRGVFEKKSCDLVTSSVKRLDLPLFERLSPFIEFSRFSDYPVKLVLAVIENLDKAMELNDRESISKCKRIIKILEDKM